jgi:hypothetical protein
VVLAGSVAADPVQRRMPSGDEVAHISVTRAERCASRGCTTKLATAAIAPNLSIFTDSSSGDAALVDSM